jgi:ABC-type nitrate/sulfonate/bicarbonate transport system permease component
VLLRSVLLPATLREVFTGLRVGFSLTLIGLKLDSSATALAGQAG